MFSYDVAAALAIFCAVAASLAALHLRATLAALKIRQAELNEDLFAANARLRDAALARRADHRRLDRYRRLVTEAARRRLAERDKKERVLH